MQKFIICYRFLFVNWFRAGAAKTRVFEIPIIRITWVSKGLGGRKIRKAIIKEVKVFVEKV